MDPKIMRESLLMAKILLKICEQTKFEKKPLKEPFL